MAGVCIVYTGKTGSGKSTLIGSLDGVSQGKAGGKSDTVKTHVTTDRVNRAKLMDTQGVADSSGNISDAEITAKVVKALKEHGVSSVKIIWTMEPSERATPELQAVAKFIHSLGKPVGVLKDLTRGNPVDIWKSVMIIVKMGDSRESACGALVAAKNAMLSSGYSYGYCGQDRAIPVFSLAILDKLKESSRIRRQAMRMTQSERMEEGILKMSEIGEWQRGLISTLTRPSKVVFEDVRCLRCGASGDPRSLLPACHADFKHSGQREEVMKSKYRTDHFHRGSLIPVTRPTYRTDRFHSGVQVPVMRNTYRTDNHHTQSWSEAPGVLQVAMTIHPMTWLSRTVRREVYGHYPCCGNKRRNSTCHSRQVVSGQVQDHVKWSGCGHRQGAPPCQSKQVQVGTETLYQKWSGCHCREGTRACDSRQVHIGEEVDFHRFSGCGCREGTSTDRCPRRVCRLCEGSYGSTRSSTAVCNGTHKFA